MTEARSGTLPEWIDRTFGATDVKESLNDVGHSVRGVWRPGLLFPNEILQGLDTTEVSLRRAEQSLIILIDKLDEIFLFVEPSDKNLMAFSHKIRELLILSATEAENAWKDFLRISNSSPPANGHFNTNSYVKLADPLYLAEFQISFPQYEEIPPIRPFLGWSAASPTGSLVWYDAYNKTKHDRNKSFSDATLLSCIQAVSANIILLTVRYGPFKLFNGGGRLSTLINHLIKLDLINSDPASFYIPQIRLDPRQRPDLICYGAHETICPWVVDPLKL
ncbi:hypothetical protein [Xanthobacter flavus]|uniref:hypothetical protein n=1 Tax=Xanthobacter flavus TaxID=281 RepID=UPI00372ABE1C